MRIYFDMDGTIANLYKVHEWLNHLLNEDTYPYEAAAPMVNESLFKSLSAKGYDFGIISWTSKGGSKEYNKRVRKVKVEWLKKNFPNVKFEEVHIVKYGTPKHSLVKNGILIDDEERNVKNWNKGLALFPNELNRL